MKHMFTLFGIFLMAVITLSCVTQDGVWKFQKLSYPVNNSQPGCFAYIPPDGGPGLSVTSIFLAGRYLYLADAYHGNIKRVDLTEGTLLCSSELTPTPRLAWPWDLAIMGKYLYVPSCVDSVYVLTADLDYVNTLQLPAGDDPYVVQVADNTVLVYQTVGDHLVAIYSPDSVVQMADTSFLYSVRTPQGKEYSFHTETAPHTVTTETYTVALESELSEVPNKLDAIYLDYNDSTLVYFDVDDTSFVLNVYKRGW